MIASDYCIRKSRLPFYARISRQSHQIGQSAVYRSQRKLTEVVSLRSILSRGNVYMRVWSDSRRQLPRFHLGIPRRLSAWDSQRVDSHCGTSIEIPVLLYLFEGVGFHLSVCRGSPEPFSAIIGRIKLGFQKHCKVIPLFESAEVGRQEQINASSWLPLHL